MKTLRRSVKRGLAAGEPLPSPFGIFDRNRAIFRRGGMQMIAGPPGSMKTVLMLNIVRNMGKGVPTLYFSSDSDDFTMATRLLARETGQPTEETEVWLKDMKENGVRPGAYDPSIGLVPYDHVKWSFHPSPDLDHMWRVAEAFRERHGEYPHHTVIDILMDVDYPGAGEQNYWNLMADLKAMGREWETSLTIVHHTSESVKGEPCPPRSAIMGKANQLPTLIMTLDGNSVEGYIKVAVVKNRFGPQDPSGKRFFRLDANPSICLATEPEEAELSEILFRDGIGVALNDKINNLGLAV